MSVQISKIGIFGGTFDPIHNGHLNIAQNAKNEYELDEVIFIPTGVSYMKTGVNDAFFRYEMVSLAVEGTDGFKISDVEIKREGNTYTCDTIAYFKDKYPHAELFFIIGTDSLYSILSWRNYEYIFANCTLLCAPRNGEYREEILVAQQEKLAEQYKNQYNASIKFIHCNTMDISSTEIRNEIRDNLNDNFQTEKIPMQVYKYISNHGLYTDEFENIHNKLKNMLTPKRYRHTIGVVHTAVELADIWGCDLVKARLAACLHDCAKYLDLDLKIAYCDKYSVEVTETEKENPELLHAKVGALVAYEEYGIKDCDILSAIYCHTTGKPDMTLLEKIIFVADYIEPGRKHSSKLGTYRQMAKEDLDKTVAHILEDTLNYLENNSAKQSQIDPKTKMTYDFYKKYL